MAKRRDPGEGSVFKRADGKYVATLDLGRNPETGKRMRRKATATSRPAALKALKAMEREADRGRDRTSKDVTVGAWADKWLASFDHAVFIGTRKPRTAKAYRIAVEKHIKPSLGAIRIDALDRTDVERFHRSLLDAGMMPSSVGRIAVVLRMVVGYAADAGAVGGNVAARVTSPPVARVTAPALAGADLDRLVAAAEPDAGRLWTLMSLTGLRIGEALGLEWDDLSLDDKVPSLRVERTAGHKAGVVGPPKSTSGRRTVPLTAEAVKVLKAQRAGIAAAELAHPAWRSAGTVFTAVDGGALALSTASGWFAGARKAAKLDAALSPHSLRHGYIRRLLRAGMPPVTVASIAGDRPATLLVYYADDIPVDDDGSTLAAEVEKALA